MSPKPLARVADPKALDACEGPQAMLEVVVPAGWLRGGARLEITAPRRLTCRRCDGGGCDGCGRSGAFRAPSEEAQRRLEVALPKNQPTAICLRLAAPFEDGEVAQLYLQVRSGDAASRGVRRLPSRFPLTHTQPSTARLWPILAVVLALSLVIFAAINC